MSITQIIAEQLRQTGRTEFWLARQIGKQPSNVSKMLARGTIHSTLAEAMLEALDLVIVPRGTATDRGSASLARSERLARLAPYRGPGRPRKAPSAGTAGTAGAP